MVRQAHHDSLFILSTNLSPWACEGSPRKLRITWQLNL